ncbi:2Fe-2S iron-sulfur cluster-binding protein [Paeniglutamicibacter gangotriensis]|uniref:Rhodocoxin n=2 Tax=Paeniglutamicibacter gangotriensis TaxID=254787 RepID=M7MST7_9MICC|nr:2Fe-2S iron-sulfur cluster-binding protein [Paeniglutamicibacter gangotriensis]EMQ99482.1 Rhodocoxin [Paeniglutamicibacter gangotriensis Lz1y]KAA0978838.1 2Fe-2S iron-sulfur cluster binding domain-containing protein [Paeniglutamicibacter gangotriensis]
MPTITFTQPTGEATEIAVAEGTSLMRAAVTNGVEGIVGECGGQAMCATCHIYVRPEFADQLPPISDDEDEMLDCTTAERTDASRLGCQVKMTDQLSSIVVDVPSDQE